MFSASTASRTSALASCRHGVAGYAMTSTGTGLVRQMNTSILKPMLSTACHASTSRMTIGNTRNINKAYEHSQRYFTSSSRSSSSSSPPEPALNQLPDNPPNPISPPGQLKNSSKNSLESFAPPTSSSPVRNSDEACQTLSPSSPAAPRTQKKQGESFSKLETSKAIPPEIVNQPSIGRKGSGKFRAQKAALTLSPTALERVRSLLDSNGGPKLLRIGVRNKGCAGMSYHLEYVAPDQAGKFDERVKQDGVEVLIDSKALFSIIGSEMDWQEDRLSAKFVFHNPNVIEACGCGESVRFA